MQIIKLSDKPIRLPSKSARLTFNTVSPFVVFALCILFMCSLGQVAKAAQEVEFSAQKRLELVIGENQPNRIQLSRGEVLNIVGDEAKYGLYWSNDFRHLFIVPKAGAGETINLSLILVGGLAQDIRFTVGDVPAQTILIDNSKLPALAYSGKRATLPLDQVADAEASSEVSTMMQAMIKNRKGKYYVAPVGYSGRYLPKLSTVLKAKNLLVKAEKIYQYKTFKGIVLMLRNKNARPVEVKAEDFSNIFLNTIAVSIENSLLARGEKVKVFIITRAKDND